MIFQLLSGCKSFVKMKISSLFLSKFNHFFPKVLKLKLFCIIKFIELKWSWFSSFFIYRTYPNGIKLVFHTKNSMKYRSLYTILKYRFNIPFRYEIPIFCTWKIKFGMLKRYLRIVCKDWYFILFSVWNTNSLLFGYTYVQIFLKD
jgi:hypothetical protein